MTAFPALLLILLLALNPPRAVLLAPGQPPFPRRQAALAALAALLILGTASLAAAPVLAELSITPETFRIAAGAVAGITGIAWLAYPGRRFPQRHPASALFPFAWPVLANPASLVLTVSFAADAGAFLTLLAIAPPLALAAGLPAFVRPSSGFALTAAARLTGALLMVAALALILRGVEAV